MPCPPGGPACVPLLNNFAQVMGDRTQWPTHLCTETAFQATVMNWLTRSQILAKYPLPRWSVMDGTFPGFPGFPDWPLSVGRSALTALAERSGGSVPEGYGRIYGALPFDDYERALFVGHVRSEQWTLDFFGLAPVLGHIGDPGLGNLMIGIDWRFSLRSQTSDVADTGSLLKAAGRWWGSLYGLSVYGGGRQPFENNPPAGYPELADRIIAKLDQRYSWAQAIASSGLSESTARRWVKTRRAELERGAWRK